MPTAAISPRVVVVTGDVTIDWSVARSRGAASAGSAWSADDSSRAYWKPGGSALLADVITAVANRLQSRPAEGGARRQPGPGPTLEVRHMTAPNGVAPDDARYHHSYALWEGGPLVHERDPAPWRVKEFLGLDNRRVEAGSQAAQAMRVVDDTPDAELVVLDDAGLGFRERSELWPAALQAKGRRPWILLKMARPVASGSLWKQLHARHADRLVVVMTVNDLRRTEVQISRELSWERTAQDLAWELTNNPRVNALSRCAHVVVSVYTAGAFLMSGGRCRLFFDPKAIEGSWQQDHPGGMIGYTTCLTAALARELMRSPESPKIDHGILSGLAGMRRLHIEGYGKRQAAAPGAALAFPIDVVVDELAGSSSAFTAADVQDPVRFLRERPTAGSGPATSGFWSILQDRYTGSLERIARRIVLEGADVALVGVPLGSFGDLLTVDRREIESFRSIRALVAEYHRQPHRKAPLSIAVFGAPGSGKSFGILEVAKSLLRGQIKEITFNLSQFRGPAELLGAFHEVRDLVLKGWLPLVFWDEFDTSVEGQPLGWLRHFLAPMQDGAFQEGQLSHPLGRSIFVFAGGTSDRIESFGTGMGAASFKDVKGPDFVSRLKGYVNILGPNRQRSLDAGAASADPYYVIRRAILLRSILKRERGHLFDKGILSIDPGVLRAFLEIGEYKHGARSIESIVTMSLLTGKTSFERSSLPAAEQLGLHVDAREFLALVQKMDLEGELLERLAEAAHEVYRTGLQSRGATTPSARLDYLQLPEDEKEQNRGTVRDIASKLAVIGYVMIPARSNQPPFDFPHPHLDLLAEMEHDRWMKAKISAIWRYGPRTIKEKRIHKALLPWRRFSKQELSERFTVEEIAALGPRLLPEKEKEKDRDLVRGIPKILAAAGYTVERTRREVAPALADAERPRTARRRRKG